MMKAIQTCVLMLLLVHSVHSKGYSLCNGTCTLGMTCVFSPAGDSCRYVMKHTGRSTFTTTTMTDLVIDVEFFDQGSNKWNSTKHFTALKQTPFLIVMNDGQTGTYFRSRINAKRPHITTLSIVSTGVAPVGLPTYRWSTPPLPNAIARRTPQHLMVPLPAVPESPNLTVEFGKFGANYSQLVNTSVSRIEGIVNLRSSRHYKVRVSSPAAYGIFGQAAFSMEAVFYIPNWCNYMGRYIYDNNVINNDCGFSRCTCMSGVAYCPHNPTCEKLVCSQETRGCCGACGIQSPCDLNCTQGKTCLLGGTGKSCRYVMQHNVLPLFLDLTKIDVHVFDYARNLWYKTPNFTVVDQRPILIVMNLRQKGIHFRSRINSSTLDIGPWSPPYITNQSIVSTRNPYIVYNCTVPDIANGTTNNTYIMYGEALVYTCSKGTAPPSETRAICQADGTFSAMPKCELINCTVPEIANATTNNIYIRYGEALVYTCSKGTAPPSRTPAICKADGTLSSMPKCELINCTVPAIANGTTSRHYVMYGEAVVYTCNTFTVPPSGNRAICQADGSLSPVPHCESATWNDCDDGKTQIYTNQTISDWISTEKHCQTIGGHLISHEQAQACHKQITKQTYSYPSKRYVNIGSTRLVDAPHFRSVGNNLKVDNFLPIHIVEPYSKRNNVLSCAKSTVTGNRKSAVHCQIDDLTWWHGGPVRFAQGPTHFPIVCARKKGESPVTSNCVANGQTGIYLYHTIAFGFEHALEACKLHSGRPILSSGGERRRGTVHQRYNS
ncbi:sushi, von Willebrand factor type A, EGF and pentraxin domain-containing protein 1-like [Sycon ciliatum]|uniref:sushi, von Willebrand factor type A, EGF and pentraxin domain-containing protein 1-like n=1 Tax=Sycon ciliatum TaxID=27933 RepID=UPI0031F5F14B